MFCRLYEILNGEDLRVAELIQRRRLQVLIHSCIYYELNSNLVSDKQFDDWSRELVQLQSKYPEIGNQVCFAEDFADFEGITGFNLPIRDPWVMNKAKWLLAKSKHKADPIISKKSRKKLF